MSTSDRDRIRAAFLTNSVDLLHYLERRVSNREDAADILSESMLIAWRKVRTLPVEPEAARMWLFVIARYTLMNDRRKRERGRELAKKLRAAIQLAQALPASPTDASVFELRDAIAALAEELAEIVRLVHWDGFTFGAAAQLLRISPSTARRRYERAIQELKAVMHATDDVEAK